MREAGQGLWESRPRRGKPGLLCQPTPFCSPSCQAPEGPRGLAMALTRCVIWVRRRPSSEPPEFPHPQDLSDSPYVSWLVCYPFDLLPVLPSSLPNQICSKTPG